LIRLYEEEKSQITIPNGEKEKTRKYRLFSLSKTRNEFRLLFGFVVSSVGVIWVLLFSWIAASRFLLEQEQEAKAVNEVEDTKTEKGRKTCVLCKNSCKSNRLINSKTHTRKKNLLRGQRVFFAAVFRLLFVCGTKWRKNSVSLCSFTSCRHASRPPWEPARPCEPGWRPCWP
jgi:hypothetical protein